MRAFVDLFNRVFHNFCERTFFCVMGIDLISRQSMVRWSIVCQVRQEQNES